MSRYVFRMPDLGEGTVSAEVIAWHVAPGQQVQEDAPLAEVSTDKAVVEVPSPVTGRIVALNCTPGQSIAVGAELVVFEIDGTGVAPGAIPPREALHSTGTPGANRHAQMPTPTSAVAAGAVAASGRRVQASPATRRRAREAGIDLGCVAGSGPNGRILAADLAAANSAATVSAPGTREIPIVGVRRLIAQRMSEAKRTIPHFSYVEEVDVTELEELRLRMNAALPDGAPQLTYLPFVIAALAQVLRAFPQCNALHDAARNVIVQHDAIHVGIATQTPDGLMVPVLRDVAKLAIGQIAAGIRRLAEAARTRQASRADLTGSTITVTSLGKLGGIVSTPIINAPEVAIVGINKAVLRPVVQDGKIVIRRVMNLSSSFDHRFVDGFDAAAMIQALKERLEQPARILMP
jgi:2-oxoisovalerate dehydrogenase E2 component (dihydrolipoyl transacylase)